MSKEVNRRDFIGLAGLAATGLAVGVAACGKAGNGKTYDLKPFLDQAPDGKELKAGLIG